MLHFLHRLVPRLYISYSWRSHRVPREFRKLLILLLWNNRVGEMFRERDTEESVTQERDEKSVSTVGDFSNVRAVEAYPALARKKESAGGEIVGRERDFLVKRPCVEIESMIWPSVNTLARRVAARRRRNETGQTMEIRTPLEVSVNSGSLTVDDRCPLPRRPPAALSHLPPQQPGGKFRSVHASKHAAWNLSPSRIRAVR